MPDHCPKCGKEIEPGDVKCPACGFELPDPGDPPPPQKAAVLAATLLPVFGILIFLAFAGAVIVGGVMLSRKLPGNHPAPPTKMPVTTPVQTIAPPPPVMAPPVAPPPVAIVPQASPPVAPSPPPAIAPTPDPDVAMPAPSITDFVPAIVPPGKPLVIRGQNLAHVTEVLLLDSQGAATASVRTFIMQTDTQLIITVPHVSFPEHGIYIAVFAPGGVAVLVEEHLGNTPWGTDGHLHHTAVNVRTGDEIVTLDHMLVFAMPQSIVSMGDYSIGFFSDNVILKAVGKHSIIYYVDPLQGITKAPGAKLLKKPSIEMIASGDAFRVQPAPADANN